MSYRIKLYRYIQKLKSVWPYEAIWVSVWKDNKPWPHNPITAYSTKEFVGYFNPRNVIYRRLLPNEFIVEIDANDWGITTKIASIVQSKALKLLDGAIPNNWFSGGRSIHMHFFTHHKIIKNSWSLFEELSKEYYTKFLNCAYNDDDVANLAMLIVRNFAQLILPKNKKYQKFVDDNFFKDVKHLIRFEGSPYLDESGRLLGYKTYMPVISQDKPKVLLTKHIEFPEKIKVWKPDQAVFEYACYYVYKNYIIKHGKPPSKKILKSKVNLSKHARILQLLKQCTFNDMRKQIVGLYIAPVEVLLNKEKVESNPQAFVEEKVREWKSWANINYQAKLSDNIKKRRIYESDLRAYFKYMVKRYKSGKPIFPNTSKLREAVEHHAISGPLEELKELLKK